MSKFFFDQRWCGQHGIGRFATEVRRRLPQLMDLPLPGSPTNSLDPIHLARFLHRHRPDGWVSPGFNVPLWANCPVVVTVHDLIHVHCSDERTLAKYAYYRFIQRPVVRRSPITLTVSEFSRRQIIEWYGVDEDRVASVGNGVSEVFTPQGEATECDKPYFLYVGNTKPHKNISTLLHAFAAVARTRDVDCKLITNPNLSLHREIDALDLGDRVQTIGGIDDQTLAEYYRGAVALIQPSFFEGFGLPIAEAMACGCPVIGANRTSIPEVMGGTGYLFDPRSAEELADVMHHVADDLAGRADVVRRGLDQAKRYRWQNVAENFQRALDRVAA